MVVLFSLIKMVGAVALLLWATHLIRTGMLRTFGETLRHWLSTVLVNRVVAFFAGIGVSSLLQSSTASALLVAGLQKKGLVTTAMALGCVLGADLGSALMVRVLSFDLQALVPVLIIIGVFLVLKKQRTRYGQVGFIFLGLALVMMSLSMIMSATAPLRESPELSGLFAIVNAYPITGVLTGVILAWACFSSLAVVMIAAGFVAAGLLPPTPSLWVVLGANLGSAFLALFTTAGGSNVARRAPLGNCVFRVSAFLIGGGIVALLPSVSRTFASMPDGVIYFHLVFNGIAGVLGLFFVNPVAQWVEKKLPESNRPQFGEIQFLTEESRLTTETSLQAARQEITKTVRLVESYWDDLTELLKNNPSYGEILLVRGRRATLEPRIKAVNAYMTAIMQGALTEEEAQNWQSLRYTNGNLQFSIFVIDGIFQILDQKKCSKNRYFSTEGAAELLAMHSRIAKNFTVLGDLLELEDPNGPRGLQLKHWLRAEKRGVAVNDFLLVESHVARLHDGQSASVETSALHIELLTLFRRVNQLVCSAGSFEAPDESDLGVNFRANYRF